MSLLFVKGIFAVLLFVLAAIGGLAPVGLELKQVDDEPLGTNRNSVANAFSGGVLLAAASVHMLPGAGLAMEPVARRWMLSLNPASNRTFPIAETIAGFSFLSLALVEATVMRVMSRRLAFAQEECRVSREPGPSGPLLPQDLVEAFESTSGRIGRISDFWLSCCASRKLKRTPPDKTPLARGASESPAAAVALLLALIVHSFLEGVGIGAQSGRGALTTVFIAVAAHKGMAAFALGSQLVRHCSSRTAVWGVVTMALCSPVGIVVGSVAMNLVNFAGRGAILASASGTFLFAAIPEMLVPAWQDGNSEKSRVTPVLVAVLAFLAMSVLKLWT